MAKNITHDGIDDVALAVLGQGRPKQSNLGQNQELPQAHRTERYSIDRSKIETKTKRLQLVVTPTVHAEIIKMAQDLNLSINETCSQLFVAGLPKLRQRTERRNKSSESEIETEAE